MGIVLIVLFFCFGCCVLGVLERDTRGDLTIPLIVDGGMLVAGVAATLLAGSAKRRQQWAVIAVLTIAGLVASAGPVYLLGRIYMTGLTSADVMLTAIFTGLEFSAILCIIRVSQSIGVMRQWGQWDDRTRAFEVVPLGGHSVLAPTEPGDLEAIDGSDRFRDDK
ncbi:hypothetical protein [Humisphaera borealis]|uniref:Uncharacterized protein n=1 Tax=Humisphaera borealis TaxID=2807512 RepID=A0A7M2WTG2_9BACT|nr:hypothetical protein [Humisphaera borealis]QOV88719.1 hypothetical protein IPV69_21180 [Humisphaera borealis]